MQPSRLGSPSRIFCYFHIIKNLKLGASSSWAEFGDFFGGLVNPVVGIATVVLIVWTLRVTRQEASDTREQLRQQTQQMTKQVLHIEREQTLAEMHKRLDGALASWNLMMSQTKPHLSLILLGEMTDGRPESFREVLYQPELELRLMNLRKSDDTQAIWNNWDKYLNETVNLLIELNTYCAEYDEAAGNRLLTDFYRRRVDLAVRAMSAIDLLPVATVDGLRMGRFLGDISREVA